MENKEMNKIQETLLIIQTRFSGKSGDAIFRGKEKLDGEWIYGQGAVGSIGASNNYFISINNKKIIEKTLSVHIPNAVDKNGIDLFCSIENNEAGDTINFNGRYETLNYDLDDGINTYMFRWETLKTNCKFVEKPDYGVI